MSDPRELVMLTQAERLLAQAKTINEVKSICDMAAAARVYYRQIELARDSAIHAATIEVTAKRKMGQLLKTANLATGARGNQHTGKMNGSQDATGPTRPRLRELNVTKSLSSRSQAIAGLPAATFDRYVNERVESRQEPTTAGLLRLARQQVVNDTVLPESHSSNRFVRDLRKLIAEGRRFSTIYAVSALAIRQPRHPSMHRQPLPDFVRGADCRRACSSNSLPTTHTFTFGPPMPSCRRPSTSSRHGGLSTSPASSG